MKLKNIRKDGTFRVEWYYFMKQRMQSHTECYAVWLEDEDGYILESINTLETLRDRQIAAIVDKVRSLGYDVREVYDRDKLLLWEF